MKQTVITLMVMFTSVTIVADEQPASTPWKGKAHVIPGKVEAEHYDEGPPGVAYHDVEEKNLGAPYRKATQVDIEKRDDASNGYGIGWTRAGEWLIYTVRVEQDGEYSVRMPVASNRQGGLFHFEIDGKPVSEKIRVPDTKGWDQLKVIQHKGLRLRKGVHRLRVMMDEQGPSGSIGDIDYFEFRRVP